MSCVWWTVRGGEWEGLWYSSSRAYRAHGKETFFFGVGIGTVVAWVFGEARRLGNALISNGFSEGNGREMGGGTFSDPLC